MQTLLNDAVAQGLIASNPATRVRALRERRDEGWGRVPLERGGLAPTQAHEHQRRDEREVLRIERPPRGTRRSDDGSYGLPLTVIDQAISVATEPSVWLRLRLT
jgi:hypothetical protein